MKNLTWKFYSILFLIVALQCQVIAQTNASIIDYLSSSEDCLVKLSDRDGVFIGVLNEVNNTKSEPHLPSLFFDSTMSNVDSISYTKKMNFTISRPNEGLKITLDDSLYHFDIGNSIQDVQLVDIVLKVHLNDEIFLEFFDYKHKRKQRFCGTPDPIIRGNCRVFIKAVHEVGSEEFSQNTFKQNEFASDLVNRSKAIDPFCVNLDQIFKKIHSISKVKHPNDQNQRLDWLNSIMDKIFCSSSGVDPQSGFLLDAALKDVSKYEDSKLLSEFLDEKVTKFLKFSGIK